MKCYYAKLTEQNEVLNVLRYDVEDEATAIAQLQIEQNWPHWKKSFEDGTRGHPAGLNDIWDPELNIFKESTKPYDSWVLNQTTGRYQAPSERPVGEVVRWNESTVSWEIVDKTQVPEPQP